MPDRVIHQPDRSRYVLVRTEGGTTREVGETGYTVRGETIVFTHTEVDPALEEHGLGTRLVTAALDDVRANRTERVIPECPFVAHFIATHDDYADLTRR